MARCLAILCALPLAVGCGTAANMNGCLYPMIGPAGLEPTLFGGVRNDVRWVGEQVQHAASRDDMEIAPLNLACAGYFGLIDLPLSLAGDTLTLPMVIGAGGKASLEKGLKGSQLLQPAADAALVSEGP